MAPLQNLLINFILFYFFIFFRFGKFRQSLLQITEFVLTYEKKNKFLKREAIKVVLIGYGTST